MPRGNERPAPPPPRGFERVRELYRQRSQGAGPLPARNRRTRVLNQPGWTDPTSRILRVALGAGLLLLLLAWVSMATGFHPLCHLR